MCAPRNSRHFDTRLCMLATNRSSMTREMLAHTDCRLSVSCLTLVHGSLLSSSCWRFPTGSPAGSGQGELTSLICFSQKAGRLVLHHYCVFFGVCAGAPSRMKMSGDMAGTIFLCRTEPALEGGLSAGSIFFPETRGCSRWC